MSVFLLNTLEVLNSLKEATFSSYIIPNILYANVKLSCIRYKLRMQFEYFKKVMRYVKVYCLQLDPTMIFQI